MNNQASIDQDNRVINIDKLLETPTGSIASYSPKLLYDLQIRVNNHLNRTKKAKAWLENAIGFKYDPIFRAKRLRMEKDTGVVHIEDMNYRITSEIKKKVIWEQEALANLAAEIAKSGEDIADYIDIIYIVPERRYNDFADSVKKMFDKARQLELGNPTYTLTSTL